MRIVIAGGGAAGFFAALAAKKRDPGAEVTILEKSRDVLAKVRISGGGRCNLTHDAPDIRTLARHYPRGGSFLRTAFKQWMVADTVDWFRSRGVPIKVEADGRMFPCSDDSASVIDALTGEARRLGIRTRTNDGAERIEVTSSAGREGTFRIHTRAGVVVADRSIVATGGSPKQEGLKWLAEMGHPIVPPVPSLFTFNLPADPIRSLMGVVADPVKVRMPGVEQVTEGPLLITHWGFSGPAILAMSGWAARSLHARAYQATFRVNWLGDQRVPDVLATLNKEAQDHPQRAVTNAGPLGLPRRLWTHLVERAGIPEGKPLGELGRKWMDRLVDVLTNDAYQMQGKTTFKEEFVTAGGVALEQVDPTTMESRLIPGLFFAGEVLDLDGLTGGFNFQAAWTTGHIAGTHAAAPP